MLQKEKELEKDSTIRNDKVKYKAKELHDFDISSFSKKVSDILLNLR